MQNESKSWLHLVSNSIVDFETKHKPKFKQEKQALDNAEYAFWRDCVAELLQAGEYFDEAENWDYCNAAPRHTVRRTDTVFPDDISTAWVCSHSGDHEAILFSPTCDNRVCPECSARHSARLLDRYVTHIATLMEKYPSLRLRTIVFTRVVELGDAGFKEIAHEGFELIQKTMRKVLGANWNKNGSGLLVNWEVGTNGRKLHYHAIYFGEWVDQRKLSKAWKEYTKDSHVVWVKGIKHNDGDWQQQVVYTLKYATKFYSKNAETGKRKYLSPELTYELFKALKGTRRIRSYGSMYNVGEKEKNPFVCADCEAPMVRVGKAHWEIWLKTGFTPDDWNDKTRFSLLNLTIANKSPPKGAKDNPVHPEAMDLLPGFDKIPVKGTAHYDYE